MKKLFRLKDHCRWELEGMTFAINKRIGGVGHRFGHEYYNGLRKKRIRASS